MTPSQLFDYMAGAEGHDPRRRVPLDVADEWRRLRCRHKQDWIRERMENSDHG